MSFTTTISSYFTSNSAPLTILLDIHAVAAGQESQRLLDALRRAQQAFARGIFAQLLEHLPDQGRDGQVFRFGAGSSLSPRGLVRISCPLISKMLRGVSAMRIFSSPGHAPGNAALQLVFSRGRSRRARFSEVGTSVRNAAIVGIQVAVIEGPQHLLRHQPVEQAGIDRAPRPLDPPAPATLTSTT